MPIVAMFDGSQLPVDAYDRVVAADPEGITDQPERLHHVRFRQGDGFVVVDVWTSPEAFEEFDKRLGPAMDAAGVALQPTIHDVHGLIRATERGHAEVATVMALYEAFGRGDVGSILDQLTTTSSGSTARSTTASRGWCPGVATSTSGGSSPTSAPPSTSTCSAPGAPSSATARSRCR